jgi:hypothetical protein
MSKITAVLGVKIYCGKQGGSKKHSTEGLKDLLDRKARRGTIGIGTGTRITVDRITAERINLHHVHQGSIAIGIRVASETRAQLRLVGGKF